MTQVPVLVRCQLPGLVHTEPKHSVFVNHRLRLTNGIHEIDPDRPFLFVVGNFSTTARKIPKNMVLGYATPNPTLLIPVDSPLVAHVTEALGYVPPDTPKKPPPEEPPDPRTELLNTPAASSTGPAISPEYARIDGQKEAAEAP